MLATSEIKKIQKILAKTEPNIKNRCNFHYLSSDPTRLKILMLLKKHSELCVSDLAKILGISISAVSHQLRLLGNCRLVKSVKTGKTVYYSLTIKNLDLNIND